MPRARQHEGGDRAAVFTLSLWETRLWPRKHMPALRVAGGLRSAGRRQASGVSQHGPGTAAGAVAEGESVPRAAGGREGDQLALRRSEAMKR